MIIGLVGVIGSGKTYQRDILIGKGFVPVDFKDALIDMTEDLVGYPIRDTYDSFKESVVGFPGERDLAVERYLLTFPHIMTGRRMLQRLGTEVMRKRDENYWVQAWQDSAKKFIADGKDIVVADVRFDNEVTQIMATAIGCSTKYEIRFCDYKSDRYDATSKHPSELMSQKFMAQGFKDGEVIQMTGDK